MATTKAKTSKARKPSSGGAKAKKSSGKKAAKKAAKKPSGAKKPAETKSPKSKRQKPAKKSTKRAAKKPRPTATKPGAELILRLDAAIYPRAVLTQAAKAFAGLARIELHKEGQEQVVSFFDPDPDVVEQLPDEYANYALNYLVTLR